MEFRQDLTKGAFALMNEMREEITKLEKLIGSENPEENKGVSDWVFRTWELKLSLLRACIEDLQEQIETQNFNW